MTRRERIIGISGAVAKDTMRRRVAEAIFAKQPDNDWIAGGYYDFDQFLVFADAAIEALSARKTEQSSEMLERIWAIISRVVYQHEAIEPAGREILETSHHAELVEALTKIRRCFVSIPDHEDTDIRCGDYAFAIEAAIQTIDNILGQVWKEK